MSQGLDWAILQWIQEVCRNGFLDQVMPFISALGNYGAIWIVVALGLMCSKKYRKIGICIAIAMAIGFLLGNVLLKNVIARPRPCDLQPLAQMLVPCPTDYSFPSGHSLHSFAAATVLFCFDKRLGVPALVLAALIAVSRLYVFVHFPSDVLCGTVLGIAIGLGVMVGYQRWLVGRQRR